MVLCSERHVRFQALIREHALWWYPLVRVFLGDSFVAAMR